MTEKTTVAPRPAPLPAELDTGAEDSTIRPFTVDVPEEELDDLRARIAATRWPEKETVDDQSQGVQLATMQALARYWATEYDWRKCEAKLNAVPHFITEIDGLDIHFIHVRSKHEDALPLIVTHGWPGSVIEQLKIIEPLTNPTAHGASAADAFHVVIPSMPGYGFSGKPTTTGWGPERIAQCLGGADEAPRVHDRYVAQGGDWGGPIVDLMGVLAPRGIARHPHQLAWCCSGRDVTAAVLSGGPLPAGLRRRGNALVRPAAGLLGDRTSPTPWRWGPVRRRCTEWRIRPSAWPPGMLDHDATSLALIARVFDGQTEGLTRDDVLDNITHYWLTNTGISSARLYWENKFSFFGPKGVSIPVAVSGFPDELYQAPRSWAEQAYPNLIHFNRLDKGGHFAAWEQPQLFSEEVRAGFRSLR